MRSTNNAETIIQIAVIVATGKFISGDIHDVCEIIDPYVDAYIELNDHNQAKEDMIHGIHLAFWIMLDEKLNFPTDPLVFSNLMARCFEYAEFEDTTRERVFAEVVKSFDNFKTEQLEWLINLTQLKSVNFNLVLSCLWSLLQIWDYLQKQVEQRQKIQNESTL